MTARVHRVDYLVVLLMIVCRADRPACDHRNTQVRVLLMTFCLPLLSICLFSGPPNIKLGQQHSTCHNRTLAIH